MPLHQLGFGALHIDTWTLFGRVPVALLFVWLLVAGLRRGWHWRSALLATGAFGAGLSIGTALLPSVLGAIGGGLGAWFLAQHLLGLRRPPLAALAAGLTLVVAIGRLGCLCSGCCFGTVSTLPWAVHYAQGSTPWFLHHALGLVADAAPTSLGVHPYPLYESVALVLWLPVMAWLMRRLRSEGAVLALTASYDLAARAGIDGLRAMLNVWWAKLGVFAGLDRLQWALLLGALGMLGVALTLERRARRGSVAMTEEEPPTSESPTPSTLATWCIFAGAWLAGLVFDDAQTPFLYRIHVLTLLAAVPAVRMPDLELARGIPRLTRQLVAPALALVLVALLARHLDTTLAQADEHGTIENTIDERGWIYEVDHLHDTLVRIGSMSEPVASLRVRHLALQLGPIPEAPGDAHLEMDDERPPGHASAHTRLDVQHWLGVEGAVGSTSYTIADQSCGGDFTAYDRQFLGGWLRYDAQLAVGAQWTASFGGRAGGGKAAATVRRVEETPDGSTTETVTREDDQFLFATAWAEIEEPHLSVGVVLYGDFVSERTSVDGPWSRRGRFSGRFGGHLRFGFPVLGLEFGYLDRDALLGVTTVRTGLVGMLGGRGEIVERLEDVRIRYGIGGLWYPSVREWLGPRAGGYVFTEILPTSRLAIGAHGAWIGQGGMFGLSLRYRVGD